MGVTGLWSLIDSSGKPVPLETLENKVLSVDISIWLHQVVKGYQDNKGSVLPNAHLLGLFNRLCKLLYYRVKPVFIFDGSIPHLKRETIAKRAMGKKQLQNEANRIQQLIMQSLAKEKIVQQALGASGAQKLVSPSKAKPSDKRMEEKDEIFKLPEMKEEVFLKREPDEAGESSKKSYDLDIYSIDLDSNRFKELPANVRLDILTDVKETRKQSSWGRLHEMPVEGDNFSNYQMQRLLKRRQVQKSLEDAGQEIGGKCFSLAELESLMSEDGIIETAQKHSRQIASDENARVMLVKDVSKAISIGKVEETVKKEEPKVEELGDEFDLELQQAIQMSLQDPSGEVSGETSSPQKVADVIDFKIKGPFFEAFIAGVDPNDIKLNEIQRKKFKSTAKTDQVRTYMMENAGMNDDDINDLLQATQSQKDDKIRSAIADILDDYVLYGSPVTNKKIEENVEKEPEIGFMSDSDDSDLAEELDKVEKSQEALKSQSDLFSSQDTVDYDHELAMNEVISSATEKSDKVEEKSAIEIEDSDDDFVEDDERAEVVEKILEKPDKSEEIFILSEDSEDETVENSENPEKIIENSKENEINLEHHKNPEKSNEDQENSEKSLEILENHEKLEKILENSEKPVKILESHENAMETLENSEKSLEIPKNSEESNEILENSDEFKSMESSEKSMKILVNPEKSIEILDSPEKPENHPIIKENLKILEKSPEKSFKSPDASSSSSSSKKRKSIMDYLEVTPRKSPKLAEVPVEEEQVPKMASPFFVKRTPSSKKKDQVLKDVLEEVREKIRVSKALFAEEKQNKIEDDIKEAANILKESKTEEELKDIAGKLMKETKDLESERNKQDRMGMSITQSMTNDCKALLRLFGIPYVESPMEAEAQAAFLNQIGLTDGTITDDSDIWLFGGKTVYKNVFQQKKIVTEFQIERVEEMFSMDREKLIQLALLCGSDYTTGIQGIGAVTALEILAAFPKTEESEDTNKYMSLLSSLRKFRDWFNSGKTVGPGGRTILKNKLKNIELHEGFPNVDVARAYLEPQVDKSTEPFSWGSPDVESIYEFAKNYMGWTRSKTDEILQPVLKRMNDKKQAAITDYFKKQASKREYDRSKMSARVQMAVKKMAGILDEKEEKPKKTKKPAKPRKNAKKIEKKEEKPVETITLSEESEDENPVPAIDRPSTSSGVFHDESESEEKNMLAEPEKSGKSKENSRKTEENSKKNGEKLKTKEKPEKPEKKDEKPKRAPRKPKNIPMNFMDKIREADRPKRPKRVKDPEEPAIKSPKLDSSLLSTTPKEKVYRLPNANAPIPQKEKDKIEQELKKQKAIELFKKTSEKNSKKK